MTATADFETFSSVLESAPAASERNDAPDTARVGLPSVRAYWARIAAVGALVAIGYGLDLIGVVMSAVDGSRTPLLALTPVLALLIASGYHRPPPGVTDNESDWLFASILGILGFAGITLVSARFETLAGLFRLDLLGAVLWAACATVIVLGARHAQRMWRVWLFAALCCSPVPFFLAAGALGGSDTVTAGLSVCFGATAVYLAGARAGRPRRLLAALLCLVIGWCLTALLIGSMPLFATVTIASAVVPVLVHVVLRDWVAPGVGLISPPPLYPTRSWPSFAALPLLALLVAVTHTSAPQPPEPPVVSGDWTHQANMVGARQFPDITRFLGPDAQFARYRIPDSPGLPAAAVDVITTPNLASLRDHRNTVWYPTTRPLNFTAAPNPTAAPVELREIFSNADTATDINTPQWYALTWEWRTAAGYQQVTVIVNQNTAAPADEPPSPQLSAGDTLLSPVLWIGRQQAEVAGPVDDTVTGRATDIADSLLLAAVAAHA